MACKTCGSGVQGTFVAEIAIHIPGLENLNEPFAWCFPKLSICLNCASAEFQLPKELLVFGNGNGSAAAEFSEILSDPHKQKAIAADANR